jgi:uncharacterized protein (DUF433 family)
MPHAFSLGDEQILRQHFREAGFTEVHTERGIVTLVYTSLDEFFAERLATSASARSALDGASEEERSAIWHTVREALHSYTESNGMLRLRNEVLCTSRGESQTPEEIRRISPPHAMDNTMEAKNGAKLLGRYIVADPKTCHDQPTFWGSRIFVEEVLEQISRGMAWEVIIEEWNGNITKEAIAEAVRGATQPLARLSVVRRLYTLGPNTGRQPAGRFYGAG